MYFAPGLEVELKETLRAQFTLLLKACYRARLQRDQQTGIDLSYESSGHYPASEDQALIYESSLEQSGVIDVTLRAIDAYMYSLVGSGYPLFYSKKR